MTNTINTQSKTSRGALTAALVLGILSLQVSQAAAVSARVRMSCIGDYFSYCSAYSLGSPQLTQCMHANGPKLSKSCKIALIAEGYATQAEITRRAASLGK